MELVLTEPLWRPNSNTFKSRHIFIRCCFTKNALFLGAVRNKRGKILKEKKNRFPFFTILLSGQELGLEKTRSECVERNFSLPQQ